ncbi:tetratricopeptide repeat-containing diguanylate cyclase [Paractinoplanes ovalisporus]|uniref:tetratricopeptide repeat-containing diguanylate cyclase n=1 Tax=Paractinoplanes ovalisporus TaxID=2810368 RepID=UPI0027DD2434|nr:GGDEF domain-containing protein [Actinoplanes ovalisporus]
MDHQREVLDAERLNAALLELEDEIHWDAAPTLELAQRYERQARLLGDELLVARARLSQINMRMRAGDVAEAAQRMWHVHQWAVDHDAHQLTARIHLVWAAIHRHLGDAAQSLEHAVRSVELLDDTATDFMQIWHRAKLADSLAFAGSMEPARERFSQAERLTVELDRPFLLLYVLNNYAYSEHAAGNFALAAEVATRLRALSAKHGYELDATVLDTIGAIEMSNGHFAEAERTMQACIEKYSSFRRHDADAMPEYLLNLARAQRGLGAYERAQSSLDESRRLCADRELGHFLVQTHQEQAELHAARGEFAEAYEAHKVFFSAYNRLQSGQREAQARTRQAMFETTEARQEAERFREQARRDPLTGLRNRRYLDEQLPRLIDNDPELTVAIVDLDHFKRINDQLSHDVGDQVLVQVAKLLETELAVVSPEGFVARMGGEEFLMVLPGCPASRAGHEIDGIRRAVRAYDWAEMTRGLPVTVSIGVAGVSEAESRTQPGLLSTADRNLYAAKHGGRDRVVCGVPGPDRTHSYRDRASAA